MKVAISTIQDVNYGNRLQNYALQTVLSARGYEVESLRKVKPCILRTVKRTLGRWRRGIPVVRYRSFNKQFIRHSQGVVAVDYCSPGLSDCYDKFVIGSDQVWNPLFGSNGPADYLPGVASSKKIAYAASFGVTSLGEAEADVAKLLRSIPYISMREHAGAEIAERLTGRQVPVVLDPTMLLSPDEWTCVARKPEKVAEGAPFVFKYVLGDDVHNEKIQSVARDMGAKVVDVRDRRLRIGPSEFVWLAAHAEAICTDSFHGCVFALLHHKPLCLFERAGKIDMSSRMDTLCDLFGMECCRERSVGFDMYGMDWEAFEARLAHLRSFSQNWLDAALAGDSSHA